MVRAYLVQEVVLIEVGCTSTVAKRASMVLDLSSIDARIATSSFRICAPSLSGRLYCKEYD